MSDTNKQNSAKGQARTASELKEIFFPQHLVGVSKFNPNESVVTTIPDSGIPMRDYFAARAMLGLSGFDDDAVNFKAMARDAYRMADAMMAARNESQDGEDHLPPLSDDPSFKKFLDLQK